MSVAAKAGFQTIGRSQTSESGVWERREAGPEARAYERSTELVGRFSHDARQTLTALLSEVDMCDELVRSGHSRWLNAGLWHISELLDHLDHHARGKGSGLKDVELGDLIRRWMPFFDLHVDGMRIVYEGATGRCFVSVELIVLKRILINLIVNASEARKRSSHEESVVRISVCNTLVSETEADAHLPAGRYAAVLVQDNGSGIKPDILHLLGQESVSSKGGDRGRGISASVQALSTCGGVLQVSSDGRSGTTFRVLLPLR